MGSSYLPPFYRDVLSRQQIVQTCTSVLEHTSYCPDKACRVPGCQRIRRVKEHTRKCNISDECPRTIYLGQTCSRCNNFYSLVYYHAKKCEKVRCRVYTCSYTRYYIKQSILEDLARNRAERVMLTEPPVYHTQTNKAGTAVYRIIHPVWLIKQAFALNVHQELLEFLKVGYPYCIVGNFYHRPYDRDDFDASVMSVFQEIFSDSELLQAFQKPEVSTVLEGIIEFLKRLWKHKNISVVKLFGELEYIFTGIESDSTHLGITFSYEQMSAFHEIDGFSRCELSNPGFDDVYCDVLA